MSRFGSVVPMSLYSMVDVDIVVVVDECVVERGGGVVDRCGFVECCCAVFSAFAAFFSASFGGFSRVGGCAVFVIVWFGFGLGVVFSAWESSSLIIPSIFMIISWFSFFSSSAIFLSSSSSCRLSLSPSDMAAFKRANLSYTDRISSNIISSHLTL